MENLDGHRPTQNDRFHHFWGVFSCKLHLEHSVIKTTLFTTIFAANKQLKQKMTIINLKQDQNTQNVKKNADFN